MDKELKELLRISAKTNFVAFCYFYDYEFFKERPFLKEVAKVSMNELRDNEAIGRMGGEEFSILLPECNADNTIKICNRLQNAIRNIKIPIGHDKFLLITASFGIVTTDNNKDINPVELFNLADLALYKAKDSGRDCIKIYE